MEKSGAKELVNAHKRLHRLLCEDGWPDNLAVPRAEVLAKGLGPLQWWRPFGTYFLFREFQIIEKNRRSSRTPDQ